MKQPVLGEHAWSQGEQDEKLQAEQSLIWAIQ